MTRSTPGATAGPDKVPGTATTPVVPGSAPLYLSRPTVTAAMLALLALALVAPQTLLLTIPFAVAILATYRYPARLVGTGTGRWLLRLGLISAAYALIRLAAPFMRAELLVGMAWGRNFFGLFFASEMTVQASRARADNTRAPMLVAFCAGLTFLTACNTTSDNVFVPWLTPVFILALALGLRSYRPHRTGRPGNTAERLASRVRLAAFIAVVAIGVPSQYVISLYHLQLTEWGNNLILQRAAEILDLSGMSDQPLLGDTFGLRGSPERVLRVSPVGSQDPYAGDPHLRGVSFDTYDLGRWGPAVSQRNLRVPADADLRVRRGALGRPLPRRLYRITRLESGNPMVYAPLGSSEIDLTDADNLVWAPDVAGPIRTTSEPPYSYTVAVPTDPLFQGILARPPTPDDRTRCLAIPRSLDANIVALVRRLMLVVERRDSDRRRRLAAPQRALRPAANAEPPAAELAERKIDMVVGYLQLHHHYSLTFHPGVGDPVSAFLRTDGSGAHCEYFASAATLLLRCAGIPSRYVIGYYVHEPDGNSDEIVRQRDAHAWAEAWVDGVGWEVVDATPGDGLPDHDPAPIMALQRLKERIQDAVQKVRDWLGDLRPDQINLLVGIATLATLGSGVAWLVRQRLRERAAARNTGPSFAYTPPGEELAHLGGRFDRVLAAWNLVPPESVPRTEFLAAAADSTARDAGEEADFRRRSYQFAGQYDRARFGVALGGADDGRLRAELAALGVELDAMEDEVQRRRQTARRTVAAAVGPLQSSPREREKDPNR